MSYVFPVTTTDRLDKFLHEQHNEFSRSKFQRLIENGKVSVNKAVIIEPKYKVQPGDSVSFDEPVADPEFPLAENNPLTILHEDADILVVVKPVNMVTHPTTFQETGTLVQSLLFSHPEIQAALLDPASSVSRLRPGIVHRLDKDTSGLLVIAKNREALLNLTEQFHNHTVIKEYEALLYGTLSEEMVVEAPIHRKPGPEGMMVASHDPHNGRASKTTFKPVEVFAPYPAWPKELATRVRVAIETGRTHQIRVHAKFIGRPILGDQMYGNKPSEKLSAALKLTKQELRAVYLSFDHPTTGKRMEFHAPAV